MSNSSSQRRTLVGHVILTSKTIFVVLLGFCYWNPKSREHPFKHDFLFLPQGSKQWFEMQDLHVKDILPPMITLSESYIQVNELVFMWWCFSVISCLVSWWCFFRGTPLFTRFHGILMLFSFKSFMCNKFSFMKNSCWLCNQICTTSFCTTRLISSNN